MLAKSWQGCRWKIVLGVSLLACGSPVYGARYADVLGYYEPGQNVDVVYGSSPREYYNNPQAALGGPGLQMSLSQGTQTTFVSLGGWTDDSNSGTNNQTPALVVGFSIEVINGVGDDLLVVGNAPSSFSFHEPGFIEVAAESDGGGAKPNGWADETFYLIKPGNFDLITDPRTGPNSITITTNPDFSFSYSPPFDDPGDLPGYFDVTHGGDRFNLDDAIDSAGDPVSLTSIAYVRLRSVSDSAFPIGSFFSPEVDYLEVLELEGDFDGDGLVGITDLSLVLNHWDQQTPTGSYAHGDGNGDGIVALEDLALILNNWDAGTADASSLSIPEPTALAITSCLCLVTLSRRRP